MSFLGSVAGPLRLILAAYAQEVRYPVLLPCAGNFTIGSALRSGGYMGRITGCDITLYTSALGAHLADAPLDVAEKEDCPEQLRGFLNYATPRDLAASVAVMLDLRQVWKNKNIWHRRELARYRAAWPQLMDKTLTKLDAFKAHMVKGEGFDYRPQCALSFLEQADPDSAVFIAPPTFGSRDYINQEKMLAAAAEWQAPEFAEISFKDTEIYERITSFAYWMIVMERPLPEVEKILGEPVAEVHKGRKSITYAYAAKARKRILTRAYLPSRSPGPIWPGNKPVTGQEEPGLVLLDKKQTVRLNELFMSVRVDYFLADVALSLGLCLDKQIIGKLDWNLTTHAWALDVTGPQKQIYLRSDLAVPSVERRLAKLVLLLVQSHEVKALIDRQFKDSFDYAVTTAFSKNSVSMKYRGIFKLHKRLEDKDQKGFRLNYYGKLGRHSMQEAYALWLKKYRK